MNRTLSAALGLAIVSPCLAATVTQTFYTRVTLVQYDYLPQFTPLPFAAVSVGDLGAVTYTYDDAAPDTHAAANVGAYGGMQSAVFTIGAGAFSAPLGIATGIVVRDNFSAQDWMTFVVDGGFAPELPDAVFNSMLHLRDASQTAFASDALPSSIDPADFALRSLVMTFDEGSDGAIETRIELEILDGPVVPLPSAAGLVLIGLGAIASRRRR